MNKRDLLSLDDLDASDLLGLLDEADRIRSDPESYRTVLDGKTIALLFEKPSTRTRVSFEAAVSTMGGYPIVLRGDEMQLERGETIEDTGIVLSRYVDAIVLRTFGQDRLERLAESASVPVVNALSDYAHPCQCLADLQTIRQKKGRLAGVRLAYLGDGNNVAHTLMFGGARTGMDIRVATPPGYQPFPSVIDRASSVAAEHGATVTVTSDPDGAARGADVLYTDTWTSMGQEGEQAEREQAFAGFQIDEEKVALAAGDAIVMHCLPAHRGQEIAASVIDGPRAVVWDQAENRLHVQKALLAWLLGG